MQSIIDITSLGPEGAVWSILGCLLVFVMFAYGGVLLMGEVRRAGYERKSHELDRERLRLLVRAARMKVEEVEESRLLWNGYRKFTIARKVHECHDVCSFYLEPHDRKPLPAFKPGQYLTFQLALPGRSKPLVRCYSLSDSPSQSDHYRVTIKRARPPGVNPEAPAGLASSYFLDHLEENDILDVKAPGGGFFLDLDKEAPVVMISGGIGITPMLSMINSVAESGSGREIWFLFGARDGSDHLQKEHLERLAEEFDHIRLRVYYSRPRKEDLEGRDYHQKGRVSIDVLKTVLPSNNFDFYVCGPGGMMENITQGLRDWDVPSGRIHFEAFGPATVKRVSRPPIPLPASSSLNVTFSRAHKSVPWDASSGSLLDFAEEHDVDIEAGCRAGNCGTCLVAIKSGEVEYLTSHGADVEEGSCLTCICKPKADLVLDA